MTRREWKEYLKSGDIPNVARYVKGGFDINSDIGVVRDKPLMLAIYSRSKELMQYLCDNGADVNAQNDNGYTALHIAAHIGWKEGVELLVGHGAKLVADKDGNYPTHVAAQQGNKETLLAFLKLKREGMHVGVRSESEEQGVDWYMKNSSGESVIDCCSDMTLKRVLVPKGEVGYSILR